MKFSLIFFLGLFSFATCSANTLLVISDSQDMFGHPSLDRAMEKFGAQTVISGIGSQYRKVYQYYFSSGQVFADVWAQILKERQGAEQLDIFAMEHGPNSTVLSEFVGSDADAAASIPFGFIHSFFSTACEDWGDFSARADGSAIQIQDVNQPLLDAFKKAGVAEYIIHGNENSGAIEIPLLVQQFRKNGSWLTEAAAAWDEMDSYLATSLSGFKGFTVDGGMDVWGPLLIARPVLGGSSLDSVRSQIRTNDMLPAASDQFMLAPNADLAKSYEANCPTVFTGVNGGSTTCPDSPSAPAKGVQAAAVFIQRVVTAYSGDGSGCIDPAPVQALFDNLLKRKDGLSPQLQSICVSQGNDSDIRVDWTLNPTPEGLQFVRAGLDPTNVANTDFWRVTLPKDLGTSNDFAIREIILERQGEIRFRNKHGQTKISINGVSASVDTKEFAGPKFITHNVGISGLSVSDAGVFSAHVSAPLFNLPVSVGGLVDGFDMKVLKILGIPFKLQ